MAAAAKDKSGVLFSTQDITFTLKGKGNVARLLLSVVRNERKKAGLIFITFCNDRFLLSLNKKYLKHTTLTDIITFQYSAKELSAEIFISIPRVKENAKKFKTSFEKELHRVMIHGVLHLCGYKDKTAAQKTRMRAREDHYLKRAKIAR